MSTTEAPAAKTTYAGFWRRLAAYLIDATIAGVIGYITILAGIWAVLSLIVPVVYLVGFWAWLGQTPGKAAVGTRIVRQDGTNIGIKKAILRLLGYVASSIILGIGFLMIAFHGQKRGLHDLIAGTVVTVGPSPLQELLSRGDLEASLTEMDEIQREHHGL